MSEKQLITENFPTTKKPNEMFVDKMAVSAKLSLKE